SKTDEFNTLYNLLANLSAKKVKPITAASTATNTAANTAASTSAIEIQNTIENTDTVDNEVIDNIVPFIKQKRTYTRRKPTHSDLDKEPPILEKDGMQCKSCLLSVPSEGALIVHYDRSPLCRKWAFLPKV
ncbi:MAG: hypothetical protein EBS28_03055, partial [Chlamydiae bacterium]|nr:hypothetical protein [Chlamydiota bacterium]